MSYEVLTGSNIDSFKSYFHLYLYTVYIERDIFVYVDVCMGIDLVLVSFLFSVLKIPYFRERKDFLMLRLKSALS